MIRNNLEAVRLRIAEVCRRCGRDPFEVVLVGVTKYSDVSHVKEAVAAGLHDIAENRVQAAKEKFAQLDVVGVKKHLIGHLQSNKAKEAVLLFDLIQSVDSVDLLEEINKRAALLGKVQEVLLQVDIAREEQKFGLPEGEIDGFLDTAKRLENVCLSGLMTMAPLTEDKERIRSVFRSCRQLFDEKGRAHPGRKFKHLSMGMSSDYELAIEEGSTMLRIGSLLFK